MSLEIAKQAVNFIERIAPTERQLKITFHGGEPLLAGFDYYKAILPLLRERFGRRLRISMQTNLWAMDDAMAPLLAEYHVSVGTSMDGFSELCDAQRGEGYYAKWKKGRDVLQRHGVHVGAICTLTSRYTHRAREVFERIGVPYALHGAVSPLGGKDCTFAVSPEEMTGILLDTLDDYCKNLSHNRVRTIDAMVAGCFQKCGQVCTFYDCLGAFAAIDPVGGVYTCQRFCGQEEYCLGNIGDRLTEADLLHSKAFTRLSEAAAQVKAHCFECPHSDYCGGCLYNQLAAKSDHDPYCESYKTVFDKISRDMALEMGGYLLGRLTPKQMPLLTIAGEFMHPYDERARCNNEKPLFFS